ncbi:hypothetical protein LCGC14_0383470 [marine sediment metagenome]|uniref:Uncharacterized protein n=1 Tax=marine sediment metagenome TaxID=412755 RepID=A0A0F9WAL6_9ZZZZ
MTNQILIDIQVAKEIFVTFLVFGTIALAALVFYMNNKGG